MHASFHSTLRRKRTVLLAVIALCTGVGSTAQEFERNKDKVMRKGRDFEFAEAVSATFTSRQGTGHQQARSLQRPITVNGQKVMKADKTPGENDPANNLHDHLFQKLSAELAKLEDGAYVLNLRDILVDTSGTIVYFGYEGVRSARQEIQVPLDNQLDIFKELCTAMDDATLLRSGTLKGNKVLSFYNDKEVWAAGFKIKEHTFYDLKPKKG